MPTAKQEQSRWEQIQRKLGERLSERLFNDIARAQIDGKAIHHPRMSASLLLAFVFATLIYATSLAFAVFGVILLAGPGKGALPILTGLSLLAFAWFARPRINRPPDRLLSREKAPHLYVLADRLADAMGAPRVAGIGLSREFNANYRVAGFPGKPYMELGLQLLATASSQEKAAIMAHELSHGANGDPLRSKFLYGAFRTLVHWALAIRPLSVGFSADGMHGGPLISILLIPFEMLQLIASETLFILLRGLLLLIYRQSQRAEYLADILAAHTVGTECFCSMLEKTYVYDTVEMAVRQQTLLSATDPLLPKIRAAVAALPPAAMEKLRQQSRESNWQVDGTHPPTANRVAMLRQRKEDPPAFSLDAQECADLEAEIAKLAPPFEKQMVNEYLESISG